MVKVFFPDKIKEDEGYQLAHIHENRGPHVLITFAVLSALATISVGLRILVRWRTRSKIEADDHTIFLTLVLAWASFVGVYYETINGLGMHLLVVTPTQLVAMTKALLFTAPTFQIAVMLNQLSILFLYRRVFTMKKEWFRWSIYGIGLFCIATGLAILFGWNPEVKGGVCYVSARKMYITSNILNLLGDLGIVILPIPLIWSLHMNTVTKAAVSGMFLLGGLSMFPISAIQHAASPLIGFFHSVTIINLIKLNSILIIKRTDFTYLGPTLTLVPCRPHAFANLTLLFPGTNVLIAIWTHADICLGIVSACLPCYRPLFRSIGEVFSINRSGKGSGAAGAPQQCSGHKSGSHGTDAYNTLGEGKDQEGDIISGSNVALVPSNLWSVPSLPGHEGKVKSMAEGKPLREDVELGMNRNAIGVTRDVDVSSVKAG